MRATFSSRFGTVFAMVGVAVGLGNVWRFPYMVGSYGGAAFVLFYVVIACIIGVPALIAEWSFGRSTQRGTVGAFEAVGMPAGRWIGWFFFFTIAAATAYYVDAIGWVAFHGLAQGAQLVGLSSFEGSWVLPPEVGISGRALGIQFVATCLVLGTAGWVLVRGVRKGIERISTIITPVLFVLLLVLVVRSVTLPGAWEGVAWFALKFDAASLTPDVALAALGQVVFSMALGGTFMVVYGSYLPKEAPLGSDAVWTASGDLVAGLLAGLIIFPAVFSIGAEPGAGPGLIFETLPEVFRQIPLGSLWGMLFFVALGGAAFLSGVAALEVLIAGVTDNTKLDRGRATWGVIALVLLLSIPPMTNMTLFARWDLLFGSGLQTLGAFTAAVAAGWFLSRDVLTAAMGGGARGRFWAGWVQWVIPASMLAVGLWWVADAF
ncbi:MAG: sodium-dependent transporter [Longimicrobiales bacterium]